MKFISPNIFFTSDWHFSHNKDFIFKARGFQSVDEMNEIIIQNYNSVIKENDIVYILGDCCLGNIETGINCIKQLKGKKYLAYGNHCSENKIKRFVEEKLFEDIQLGYHLIQDKTGFWLTHYPMMMGNYQEKLRQINLSGHNHSINPFILFDYGIYNVGVDAHNCMPINFEQVIEDIKNKGEECKNFL